MGKIKKMVGVISDSDSAKWRQPTSSTDIHIKLWLDLDSTEWFSLYFETRCEQKAEHLLPKSLAQESNIFYLIKDRENVPPLKPRWMAESLWHIGTNVWVLKGGTSMRRYRSLSNSDTEVATNWLSRTLRNRISKMEPTCSPSSWLEGPSIKNYWFLQIWLMIRWGTGVEQLKNTPSVDTRRPGQ